MKRDIEEGHMSADRHAAEAHASGPARAKQRVEATEAAADHKSTLAVQLIRGRAGWPVVVRYRAGSRW